MRATTPTIELLILVGRPASGKSEIIDHLQRLSPAELQSLHLGPLQVIDDFPMLWTWFEEDELLQQMGHPRLHSTPQGYFREQYLWDLLIRRLCLEYGKRRPQEAGERGPSTILEFSRGSEHGGYRRAFAHLSDEVLPRASILYVRVSFEESLRKNRRRYNPRAAHSILEHSLPDAKLEHLYRDDDWVSLCPGPDGYLQLRGVRVPYAVLENEDDVTTQGGRALGRRLQQALGRLAELQARKAVVDGTNPQ